MGVALQKTVAFLLLIGIGVLLKKKITTKEELKGVKAVILNIALPATIFVALLKIEIKPSLLLLPVLALAANLLLWFGGKFFMKFTNLPANSPRSRTLNLLIPSLAPGLSCFPFVAEFLGEETLAMAAFADVGNKIFVLIILYAIAMNWYYQLVANQRIATKNQNGRLKDLGLSLLKEPINMVLVIAILMLCLGLNLQSLPAFLQDSINRLSVLMTPLVLLFIGIAVKIKKEDMLMILQILCWRSGFAFLISGLFLYFLPSTLPTFLCLLVVAFPQSACSFWPYAHMTAIETLELDQPEVKTFDLSLGLNILAFSLPFSTLVILTICSSGQFFAEPTTILGTAVIFIGGALLPFLIPQKKVSTVKEYKEVIEFSKE